MPKKLVPRRKKLTPHAKLERAVERRLKDPYDSKGRARASRVRYQRQSGAFRANGRWERDIYDDVPKDHWPHRFEKSAYMTDKPHPNPRFNGVKTRKTTTKPISQMTPEERQKVRETVERERSERKKGYRGTEEPRHFGQHRRDLGPGNFRYENYAMEDMNLFHRDSSFRDPKSVKVYQTASESVRDQGLDVKRGVNFSHFGDKDWAGKNAEALATPVGGKRDGKAWIRSSKGRPVSDVEMRHELRHAGPDAPKRSEFRMNQIFRDPKKIAREEARAMGPGEKIKVRGATSYYDDLVHMKRGIDFAGKRSRDGGAAAGRTWDAKRKSLLQGGFDADAYIKTREKLSKLPRPKNDPANKPLPAAASGDMPRVVSNRRKQLMIGREMLQPAVDSAKRKVLSAVKAVK